jgi:hypothetical protein
VNSFKNALLVSSVLTTIGFSASATTYTEDVTPPPTNFPDTSPGTPIDFSMFQSVKGTVRGATIDPTDFFTFTGLTAGDNFSITFATCPEVVPANPTCPTADTAFTFTADGLPSVTLAAGGNKTDTGVLAGTTLTVEVSVPNTAAGTVSAVEGYTVTLSETTVPEPSAAAIFAVGLAGLAGARRKRYRRH